MQDRLYRALLRLLPRDVRDAYARDMELTFRAERNEARGSSARMVGLWLRTIGGIIRSAPGHHWDLFQRDVRIAWRMLASRPIHLLTAAGTLALGIGAAIAMFAIIDAVLLRPLPYADAHQLITIQETSRGGAPGNTGYLTFTDLKERARTVQHMSAATQSIGTLTGGGRDAERVPIMRASASYFEMIGARPAMGRMFTDAEDKPGPARRVTILSDALWRRRFDADPAILNRVVDISGTPFTVVGVMPAGFNDIVSNRLYQQAEMWTPLGYDPAASFACRTCRHLRVFARLEPQATAADAARELSGIIAASAAAHPTSYSEPAVVTTTLEDFFLGPVRPVLRILAVGVALLLLVACGNVANLLLIRATERSGEMAIRTALGVTRSRLLRQLLTESWLLATIGVAVGLPIAYWAIRIVVANAPPQFPRLSEASIDLRTALIAAALSVGTAILFGLVPALHLGRQRPAASLRDGSRRTAGAGTWRTRAWLVAGNMTIAAVLVMTGGLVARSLMGLLAVDTGLRTDDVVTARIALSGERYSTGDNAQQITRAVAFYDDVLGRIRALPGVTHAAGVTTLPLSGNLDSYGLHVAGRELANPESAPSAHRFVVTPGFFETLGIRAVQGRLLNESDQQSAPLVAVVNETLAREMFPDGDAVGRQIRLGPAAAAARTIVGVARDIKHLGLDVPGGYQAYVPQSQWAWAETLLTLVIRTDGTPAATGAAIRDIVRQIDPAQPVTNVRAYSEIVGDLTSARRLAAALLVGFAAAATLLAAIGLYGALGVVVGQRTQEIGVRLALGADARRIAGVLLAQGLRPAIAGLAAGLGIVALAGGVLRSLLFEIDPLDPLTLAAAAGVLVLCAVAASAIPAWRATRVDPVSALRGQT